MVCDLLDFRCIIVSELIGSTVLTAIILAIGYLIIAGKLRFGFDTTIALAFPVVLIIGMATTGFAAIYAFMTIIVALMIAWVFQKIIGT